MRTLSFAVSLSTVFALCCLPSMSTAQVVIDTFANPSPAQSGTATYVLAEALGGERDVEQVGNQNTATVGDGLAICTGSAQFNGCVFEYDGLDGDAINPDDDGLAPTDLTDGGSEDRLRLATTSEADDNCNLQIRFCSTDLALTTTCQTSNGQMVNGSREQLFSDFPSVDFTRITSMYLNISPQTIGGGSFTCTMGPASTVPVELETLTID